MDAVNADILIINTNAPIKNRGKKMVKKELVKFWDRYAPIVTFLCLAIDDKLYELMNLGIKEIDDKGCHG